MIFTQEDKVRILKQVKVQMDKDEYMTSEQYVLHGVRFDQRDRDVPSIAIIYKKLCDKFGDYDANGEWYYTISWAYPGMRRGKLVFNKREYDEWADIGESPWEGFEGEYNALIGETSGTYPEWEYEYCE